LNIKKLYPRSLYDILLRKYKLRPFEAQGLSDFLGKMLTWEPKDRLSAAQLLDHYWLNMIPNYNTHMTREEHREYKRVNGMSLTPSQKSSNVDELSDSGFSDNVLP